MAAKSIKKPDGTTSLEHVGNTAVEHDLTTAVEHGGNTVVENEFKTVVEHTAKKGKKHVAKKEVAKSTSSKEKLKKNKVFKAKKQNKRKVNSSILHTIYQHIDSSFQLPIKEYENNEKNSDPVIYNTGVYVIKFALLLVPMICYLRYLSKQPKICDSSDKNSYCFNNNETYCKNGYEAKYTLQSGYGLLHDRKKCVVNERYMRERSKLVNTDNNKKNRLILALRDTKAEPMLNIEYLQKSLLPESVGTIKHSYPLKKINKRKYLDTNIIERSRNKDSIFYRHERSSKIGRGSLTRLQSAKKFL
ncbi:hypothetical protein QEN19_000905 [Hanseniaspora menglaensis]